MISRKGRDIHGRHSPQPQDIGLLAGLGVQNVLVYKRPRIAIISTGDEVIPVDQRPEPGQVRDINNIPLSAFCRQSGTDPISMGLCKDNFPISGKWSQWALNLPTPLWLSGGSS